MNPIIRRTALGVAIAGLTLPVAHAGAGTTQPILSGPLAAGGTWNLAAERKAIGSVRGLCLHLGATFADGSTSGTATGCAAGSLRAAHNVFTVAGTSHAGATQTSYLLGGVTVRRGRVVRIVFADGKRTRIRTRPAPRAWRRALATRVRYFGADLLSVSTAKIRRVSVYDRHGRRVARVTSPNG